MTYKNTDDFKSAKSWFTFEGQEVVITDEYRLPANVPIVHSGITGKCLITVADAMTISDLEVSLPYSNDYLGAAGECLSQGFEIMEGAYVNPENEQHVSYGYLLMEDAEHEKCKEEVCKFSTIGPWDNKASRMRDAIIALMREWNAIVSEYDDPFGTVTPLTFKELVAEAERVYDEEEER